MEVCVEDTAGSMGAEAYGTGAVLVEPAVAMWSTMIMTIAECGLGSNRVVERSETCR